MLPAKAKAQSSSHRYRVLLVDDDAAVLRSMAVTLEHDLDVAVCSSAERALALLEKSDFHVVCSDYAMAGMSGLELLRRVSKMALPTGCLLVTGSTAFAGRDAEGAAEHYVLMKPVEPARLSAMVLQLARTAEMKRNAKPVLGVAQK